MSTIEKVTLYKKAKNGKAPLILEVTLCLTTGRISQQAGSCPPTDIPRTLTVTPSIQFQRLISRKLREGYSTDPSLLEQSLLPMKSQTFNGRLHEPDRWVAQLKLNGVRCLASCMDNGQVVLHSKKRKEILSMGHLNEQLETCMKPGDIWDGELYRHGLTLQALSGMARRHYQSEEHLQVQFHLFDQIQKDRTFEQRYRSLPAQKNLPSDICKVKCTKIASSEILPDLLRKAEDSGYEGLMLRRIDSFYESGHRSQYLLKYKSFQDAEFEIIGCKTGRGKAFGLPIFICRTESGEEFDVKMEGSDEYNRDLYKNRETVIGKMLTVRFFEYTPRGVPEFPIGVCVRDYE